MEGIGSRTGRPSSRYGSAPVFTGPVRRWQKQWVNVSSSSSSITYNHNNSSNSNGSNNSNVSAIRIRRWTPVPSGRDSESVAEERPKRKIRYAPIVVLDGKRKEAEKGDVDVKEASKPKKSPDQDTLESDDNEKKSFDYSLAEKPQASQKNVEASKDLNNQPMDSDAGGDDDEDLDLGGDNKVADWVKAAQRGFAS
ncbi:hypothetical protein HanXRQr2_Chr03g0118151 [Helianthus annuus]|uniref:Uncharacterized protein n=1 Tax=Helianthus annuus TaxID=4232 RepID=A0A251V7K6_HELAN|nr:probable DNA-directed RNA polymerase I subunit RPA43 [Helianthus annuus]KAF5815027.1 hypothetical protein HanXRQr2_Chr03g0118151 [Helianthus annuus]